MSGIVNICLPFHSICSSHIMLYCCTNKEILKKSQVPNILFTCEYSTFNPTNLHSLPICSWKKTTWNIQSLEQTKQNSNCSSPNQKPRCSMYGLFTYMRGDKMVTFKRKGKYSHPMEHLRKNHPPLFRHPQKNPRPTGLKPRTGKSCGLKMAATSALGGAKRVKLENPRETRL